MEGDKMADAKSGRRDLATWLKPYVDLVLKLTPALATIVAAFIAVDYQSATTGASLLNQREQAETQLRATMFSNLITPMLGDKNEDLSLEEQKLLVEMLTLNFHEHVEFKPLLLHVDKQLLAKINANKKDTVQYQKLRDMRDSLISVVRRVRDRQVAILQKECRIKGSALCPRNSVEEQNNCAEISIEAGKTDSRPAGNPQCLRFSEKDSNATNYVAIHYVNSPDRQYEMAISMVKPNWDEKVFTVSIRLFRFDPENGNKIEIDHLDFDLTPFDLPFTDNTILDEKHRFSLVLDGVSAEAKSLQLLVIWFPEGYILPYERPVNFQEIREVLNLE